MLPHLLVLGARSSLDPRPMRLRQEAKRGARRRWRRDRWRNRDEATVTYVFNTARLEGHQISKIRKELEEGGLTARRQWEELLLW